VGTIRSRPPRVRRRPVHPHAPWGGLPPSRSSPATYGSTPYPWVRMNWHDHVFAGTPVHPHARGDDRTRSPIAPMAYGSPPRPWRRNWFLGPSLDAAGATSDRQTPTLNGSDHPTVAPRNLVQDSWKRQRPLRPGQYGSAPDTSDVQLRQFMVILHLLPLLETPGLARRRYGDQATTI
jgi:hypothetical protein